MSDNITKRVGLGTAYGFAKAGGYEGTVAEFTELLGNIAIDLARIENLSVTVTTLPAGSQATASLNGSVLSLGIPKGDKGDKGNTGDTGSPAGFGTVSATVDANIGTPSVEVTASGADTAKNFAFAFHNLKGQKGDKGDTGDVTLSQLEDFTVVQTDENVEPYNFRATPKCGHIERLKKAVGVSVAYNQLCNGSSVTVQSGHKYFLKKGGAESVATSTGSAITGLTSGSDMVVDLTLALGSTIADYVYSLEQATAGSGVAWLKQHFPKMFGQYNAYDAGSIRSVEGVSAHITKDADENVLGSYPLDSDLTLRGILKISNGNLYADGDEYGADGSVSRRYEDYVFTGNETIVMSTSTPQSGTAFRVTLPSGHNYKNAVAAGSGINISSNKYVAIEGRFGVNAMNAGECKQYGDTSNVDFCSTASTVEGFKAELTGSHLVYELATPTTETADPYTENQICENGGTEEFVSTSIVPVGHETEYPLTLSDIRPTANGNYVLKCTVTNGKASYEWVSA